VNESIRNVLEKIPYGLYIVTAEYQSNVYAMIASWVSQASYRPPMVVIGIRNNRTIKRIIPQSKVFGLNLLHSDQKDMVQLIKTSAPEAAPSWLARNTPAGAPMVKDVPGFLELRLVQFPAPGDHTLFVGRILDGWIEKDGEQLKAADFGKVYIGEE
jgi:flavin reductase (DIM6/NTAB) family NADH-FMN oxidoreductase RutF